MNQRWKNNAYCLDPPCLDLSITTPKILLTNLHKHNQQPQRHSGLQIILSIMSQSPSPLLQLPRELRDEVYRHLLVRDNPNELFHRPYTPSNLFATSLNHEDYTRRCLPTEILRTNRQVYHEASDILWRENTIRELIS